MRAHRPAPTAGARHRQHAAAFTLVEAIAVLAIIGALAGIATLGYHGVRRGQLDAAGQPTLGAAQVDGRRVAAVSGQKFPDSATLLPAMNSRAVAVNGATVRYQTHGSTAANLVAVAHGDANTVGYAVATSLEGSYTPDASGAITAADVHCSYAIDSLLTGTIYAKNTLATDPAGEGCTPALALLCEDTLASTAQGDGTPESPYLLPANCAAAAPPVEPLDPPSCVVAQPLDAAPGVPTRSARVSWVPSGTAERTASYTVLVAGTTTRTITGVDAGARTLTVDDLAPGGTYTFSVVPVDESGTAYGSAVSNTAALSADKPVVTSTATTAGVELSWPVVPGADRYTITRTPAFASGTTTDVYNGAASGGLLTFTDTTVSPNVRYGYTVQPKPLSTAPVSQCGQTVLPAEGGTEWTEIISPNPLTTPTLTASTASGQVVLDWTTVPDAAYYEVWRTPASGLAPLLERAPASQLGDDTSDMGGFNRIVDSSAALTLTRHTDTTAVVADDSPQRAFTYRVRAVNIDGSAFAWSNSDVVMLAPAAPTLTATPNTGTPTTALDLSWTAPATAVQYRYTLTGPGGSTGLQAGTTATVTGLRPSTPYTATAAASNITTLTYRGAPKQVGGWSEDAEAQARTDADPAALLVIANNTTRFFDISWAPSAGATAYLLETSADGTNWSTVTDPQTVTATKVSVTARNAGAAFAQGTARLFRLTATVSGSPVRSAVAGDILAPSVPTVSAALAHQDLTGPARTVPVTTVSATSAGATAVTFNAIGSKTDLAGTFVSGSTYRITAELAPAAWFGYEARSVAARTVNYTAFGPHPSGSLTLSAPSSKAAAATAPTCSGSTSVGAWWWNGSAVVCRPLTVGRGAVTGVTPPVISSITGRHDLQVNFNALPGVTAFSAARAPVAAPGTLKGTEAWATTSASTPAPYTDASGLAAGSHFAYRVTPLPKAGVVTMASLPKVGLTVPAPPTLTVTATGTTENLSWTAPASTTGYEVRRVGTGALPWPAGVSKTATTFADKGLNANTRYRYQVFASNASGLSDPSNQAGVCTIPSATSGVKATPGSNNATLTWTANGCADSFNVYVTSVKGGNLGLLATGRTGTSMKVTKRVAGITYYFQVRGVNGAGTGPEHSSDVGVVPQSSYANAVLASKPLAYYRMHGGGATEPDLGSANKDGTYRVNGSTDVNPAEVGPWGSNNTPFNTYLGRWDRNNAVLFNYRWNATTKEYTKASSISKVPQEDMVAAEPGLAAGKAWTVEFLVYSTGSQRGEIVNVGENDCRTQYVRLNVEKCNGIRTGIGYFDERYSEFSASAYGNHFVGALKGQFGAHAYKLGTGWRHVAMVATPLSGGRAEVTTFIGGVERSSRIMDLYDYWANPGGMLRIGGTLNVPYYAETTADTRADFFEGPIDEVAVYQRALPASEISSHYETAQMLARESCTRDDTGKVCGE